MTDIATAGTRPSVMLSRHRDSVVAAVLRHKGRSVRVFGSVARGEDTAGSDVDLLVRFADGASLFDQIGLQLELEDLLGVGVDVVSEGGLGPKHAHILADACEL